MVAASLIREGYPRSRAIGIAWLTGAVEPVGAPLGAGVLAISSVLLPAGLSFAAGAMLFVVSDEELPESHRGEHAATATWRVVVGFALMIRVTIGNYVTSPRRQAVMLTMPAEDRCPRGAMPSRSFEA